MIGMLDACPLSRCLHENGVLHRDIKPSNFAIGCRSHDQHQIYILDFGLSRIYRTADGKVRQPRPFVFFGLGLNSTGGGVGVCVCVWGGGGVFLAWP